MSDSIKELADLNTNARELLEKHSETLKSVKVVADEAKESVKVVADEVQKSVEAITDDFKQNMQKVADEIVATAQKKLDDLKARESDVNSVVKRQIEISEIIN